MAAPKTTIWNLEPHTRAKHAILRRYLQAWIPILSHGGFPHVLYVDGFAGPGRYSKGEDGSPVIALRAALDQRTRLSAKLSFLFVEIDKARAEFLQQIVDELERPENFHVEIAAEQTFESACKDLLNSYRSKGKSLPPTFAFIDPFGWMAPFSIVKELVSNPNCEVLITFMYEEINRFLSFSDQEANFDAFFGTPKWREGITLASPGVRNRFLHDLYLDQLRTDARMKYARSFEMRNQRDVTDYFLFYATNSSLGLKKMKEAMWKVDETGEFLFSDATNENQLVLFEKKPRFDILREEILSRFKGRETTVGEIETFVLTETAFRETHYKGQVLKPLELATPPLIEVVKSPKGRRSGTYADPELRLRFK